MQLRRKKTISTEQPSAEADWHWQLRNAVVDPQRLSRWLELDRREIEGLRQAATRGLSLRITPYYLALCDPRDSSCALRRQCIPRVEEGLAVRGELEDPLGEREHEVAPHLLHRYPDRALLLATYSCAVHCRFCTRSHLVRTRTGAVSLRALEPAFRWLREHPEVREVLVSGGDPLTMSDQQIVRLLERVRSIESVELVRLATRVPAVLPMRIDERLVQALRSYQPLWFMVHFNHPRELTEQATRALELLADGGFPVMSQTVLLRGVNDEAEVLAKLFRALVKARVRPYYLLHGDVAAGTWHLRTSVGRSLEIMGELQGALTGIAVPKLMIDTPGGRGKVPVGLETIVGRRGGVTTVRTYRGEVVEIVDPPEPQTR